ncbi:hypothetical protein SAMN02745181_0259 [Rubritalea squalenifaciens DSM 18772]|uniref:Uncharacterized protein n=1 Tax=Rubritalea squalenifaciens DSM 18772 TaxID=1123071 RepID=A0A1M6BLZ0_9BACT|nr:hypothetical protein [Rubritalea squalenifaciens]SHI49830.1 hypothetical protein SAMN02745181_0259 [Rubritalea squalenifaciens DSM 18772]
MKCVSVLFLVLGLLAQLSSGEFKIESLKSGISYPTEGDEEITIKRENIHYRALVLHPKIIEGLHVSVSFFVVNDGEHFKAIATAPSHLDVLSWHSLNQAYFFSAQDDEGGAILSGFFLEDGHDNADNGSAGLIFLYQSRKATAWRWHYVRDPQLSKGKFFITEASDRDKSIPNNLIEQLTPILKHAEKEADSWPGP